MTCRCQKHHVCANHLGLSGGRRLPWWRRLLRSKRGKDVTSFGGSSKSYIRGLDG